MRVIAAPDPPPSSKYAVPPSAVRVQFVDARDLWHSAFVLAFVITAFTLTATNAPTAAQPSTAAAPTENAPLTHVTPEDREAAATTSGVGAFVGATLGGVIVPGASSFIGGAFNARPAQKDLVVYSTVGGAVGAGVGAALGAIPTTTPFLGQPVVGAAGAVGALVGLLPSLYFARLTPKTVDPNDPVRLAQSGCLLVAVIAAPAAAAGTAALFAEPGVGR